MFVAEQALARILIVDDDTTLHRDLRNVLQPGLSAQAGSGLAFEDEQNQSTGGLIEVESAQLCNEALDMLDKARQGDAAFDLAIFDLRRPTGRKSFETIERLWERDPHLQIIVCASLEDYAWDDITERLGEPDRLLILKKPFDNRELIQAVRNLREKRQLLSQAQCNVDTLQHLVASRSRELEALHLESESLLSAISAGLVAYDAFGFVTRWNGVAEKLFRLTAQETVSQLMMELKLPWEAPDVFSEFFQTNQYLNGKRIELKLVDANGEPTTVEVSLHPVSMNGLPVGGLMLVDDVTARRHLEHQLNQAQKLEAVGQLAAGIAHEINTPMQYVGDNVQFLHSTLDKVLPTFDLIHQIVSAEVDQAALVSKIRESAARINWRRELEQLPSAINDVEQGIENVVRIVQAMKELSHPGTETPTALDIHRILESAVVVARSEWKRVATVEMAFAPNPPCLLGFANQLQQVILNLLVNATHAVEARYKGDCTLPGRIRIATQCSKDRFLISIEDNGCGIPEKIRDRVFEPFFTTKGVGKGTGQGLAIAHQMIAKNHQGRLWFESVLGTGTTFFIELPARTEAIV